MTLINLTVGDVTLTVSEYCRNGHKRTESNTTAYRSNGKDRVMCVICRRAQIRRADKARAGRKRKRNTPQGVSGAVEWVKKLVQEGASEYEVMLDASKRVACARIKLPLSRFDPKNQEHIELRERAYNDILEARYGLAKDDSKKPWQYLKIKPEARAAWDAFNAKLQVARDTGVGLPNCEDDPGPWMDYENLPTSEEAYSLCDGCPLLAECGLYAELERPAHGVWAGDVWSFGEVVNE